MCGVFVCERERAVIESAGVCVVAWTLYNEERRLGDQRGSDTLVVPLITSNDGLSIAFLGLIEYMQLTSSAYKTIHRLELVMSSYITLAIELFYVWSRRTFHILYNILRVSFMSSA